MKQLLFAGNAFLLDGETADLLVEYSATVIRMGTADAVEINALSPNGDEVTVNFLLSAGMPLMAESSRIDLPVPENSSALTYMRTAMARLTARPSAIAADEPLFDDFDAFET